MENQKETKKRVLVPLKFSSSFFYSFDPNYDFTLSSEMIKAEQIEKRDAETGRFNHIGLHDFFIEPEVGMKEERDIPTQLFRCCVEKYPVQNALNLLHKDWDKLCWTQRQIKAFMRYYGRKILSVLNTLEEPTLPNHILFLAKLNSRYVFANVVFHGKSEEELYYWITYVENSSMIISGFLVVPLYFPAEIIYETQK